jgi:SAM-dependent methyltransferase
MRSDRSVPAEYFEDKYARQADPWGFATRTYEAAKYQTTLATLTHARYASAFEIGCSIGVFTAMLAQRTEALLAVDVSATALAQARRRCAGLPHVRFRQLDVPRQFPAERFDLIVLSEVGYYWSRSDLQRARRLMIEHLLPGGELLLVHWTPPIDDAPLTGDAVHDTFVQTHDPPLRHVRQLRRETYRLDLLAKRD